MKNTYKNYFKYYLVAISVFAIIWLYLKHSVGNDSTISEWIINYQGGFTRRGLPGVDEGIPIRMFPSHQTYWFYPLQSQTQKT